MASAGIFSRLLSRRTCWITRRCTRGYGKRSKSSITGERRLAVLTNKPVRISGAILDGLGVGEHFFRVYGGNSFDQKKPHPIGIETLCARDRRRKGADSDGGRQRCRYPDRTQCRNSVLRRHVRLSAGGTGNRARRIS